MARHVVASVGEIAPGSSKLVTVKGREIGVFNIKGEFFALANKCPHEGAALCRGKLVGLALSDEVAHKRSGRLKLLQLSPFQCGLANKMADKNSPKQFALSVAVCFPLRL